MTENWWPSKWEYNPKITKEKWLELLNDEKVFNFNSMCMMKRFFDFGGEATCAELAEKYGKTDSSYNMTSTQLARRILKKEKIKTPPENLFPVLYLGRRVSKEDSHKGFYIWKLRDELKEALEEIDLSKYPLKEDNSVWKKLLSEYKKLLKTEETRKVAFDDEAYKWQTITDCKELKGKNVLAYLTDKKSNLFDHFALGEAKYLLDQSDFDSIYENLVDEKKELSSRLQNFKNSILATYSESDKNRLIKDERSASVFLTCNNPQKYTFYKSSYYDSLCKYLKIDSEVAGEKYEHYLSLIEEFVSVIEKDSEIMNFYNDKTGPYEKSIKLIAQNIIYVLFESGAKFVNLSKGENGMSKSSELIEYTELLKNKLNVILQGAPGTGKTYTTASLALSICGEEIDYNNRDAVMERYKELREEGRIGFCTFHQSMDYEDFIEGLRPFPTESGIIYKPESGLFKIMCERSSKNQSTDIIKAIDDYIASIEGFENKKKIPTKSGRSSLFVWHNPGNDTISTRSTLSTSSKGPEHTPSPLNIEKIKLQALGEGVENNWEHYAEAFINAVKKEYNLETTQSNDVPYVLIIDEINRGYVSKIFGELITLLETDKRLGNSQTELTVELPYSS